MFKIKTPATTYERFDWLPLMKTKNLTASLAGNLPFSGTLLPTSSKSDESANHQEVLFMVYILSHGDVTLQMRHSWNNTQHLDVGSACVDIRPSPKTDVLVDIFYWCVSLDADCSVCIDTALCAYVPTAQSIYYYHHHHHHSVYIQMAWMFEVSPAWAGSTKWRPFRAGFLRLDAIHFTKAKVLKYFLKGFKCVSHEHDLCLFVK